MFIVLEGPNGVGKTTLVDNLSKKGYKTLSSPKGTSLARMIRPACRGEVPWEDIDKRVQFMLFSAARLDEYIRLVHGKDEPVIADRWWTSTYIYQCLLQGIQVDFMEYTIHPEEKINFVVLLDGDDDVLISRVKKEREENPTHGECTWTRAEDTMKKLIGLYRYELKNYLLSKNIRCITIDTTNLSIEDVQKQVEQEIILEIKKELNLNKKGNDE